MVRHEEASEEVMPRSNVNASSSSSSEIVTSTNNGVNNKHKSINEKQANAKSDNESSNVLHVVNK